MLIERIKNAKNRSNQLKIGSKCSVIVQRVINLRKAITKLLLETKRRSGSRIIMMITQQAVAANSNLLA